VRQPSRLAAPGPTRALAWISLVLLLAAGPSAAQSFAVGVGGSLISDQGTLVDVNAFDRGGGFVFGDLQLSRPEASFNGVLQLRWTIFSLPGGAPDSPSLAGNSGLLLLFYRYRETWWQAGIFGGFGVFHFAPKDPEPGQVVVDPNETVVGWCLGVDSVFRLSRSFDARLELSGQLPRTEASHKIIALSVAIGYRF